MVVPALQPKCYAKTPIDSSKLTQQDLFRNAPVHLRYGDYGNNSKRSVIFPKNIIHLSRSKVVMPRLSQKFRLSNGSIHANDVSNQPSVIKNNFSLHNLRTNISTPRNTSSHSNYSSNATYFRIHHPQPWISALFLILILSRSQLVLLESTDMALVNVVTMTYLDEENASYGAYYMWSNVGTALSICFAAGLSWFIRISICGVEEYGYFIAFIWGSVLSLLSMLSLPWFKFEYNNKKSFNWSGVKSDVFNAHCMFMFILLFYTGLCLSFQIYWEFWFFDGLFASPLLLVGAIVIRRPLVAMSTLASSHFIRKIGDLKTVCLALFLYAVSFLALSFAQTAWLIVLIDTFQAVANGISYCAFTVLFYKASSTENSSIILGMYQEICT